MQITITGYDFNRYLKTLYDETSRRMRFRGQTPEEFRDWEIAARARAIELLSIDHLPIATPSMHVLDETDNDGCM